MSAEPLRDWAVNGNLWTAPWRDAMLTMLRNTQDPFAALQMLYFGLRNIWTPSGDRAKPDPHGAYSGLGFVLRSFPGLHAVPAKTPSSGRWSSTALAAVDSARTVCKQHGVSLVLLTPPQLVEQESWRVVLRCQAWHGLTETLGPVPKRPASTTTTTTSWRKGRPLTPGGWPPN